MRGGLIIKRRIKVVSLSLMIILFLFTLQKNNILAWQTYDSQYYNFNYPKDWEVKNEVVTYNKALVTLWDKDFKNSLILKKILWRDKEFTKEYFYSEQYRDNLYQQLEHGKGLEIIESNKISPNMYPGYKIIAQKKWQSKTEIIIYIDFYIAGSTAKLIYVGKEENYQQIIENTKKISGSIFFKEDLFTIIGDGFQLEVEEVIKGGANVNSKTKRGYTPLVKAAIYNSDPEIISTLLDAGAEIDVKIDKLEKTPLMLALENNQNSAVSKELIDKGADLQQVDLLGNNALIYAIKADREIEVIEYLIEKGVELDLRGEAGFSPLSLAIKNNDLTLVKLLIESGANVNIGRSFLDTRSFPLIVAAQQSKDPAIVELLLRNGADANIETLEKKKPLDYAKENNHLRGTNAYQILKSRTK